MVNKFIHVKQLEKYHPGYKDRTLVWAKIHFNMVQGDPDCEMIGSEIDWARLVKFILLELQAQKPIPLNSKYLTKKGFDLNERPILPTLKMLQNFISVVTEDSKVCALDKSKNKIKNKNKRREDIVGFEKFWNLYDKKVGNKNKLLKKWNNLTPKDKLKIFIHIPLYKISQPNKRYRKNPETFLNNKSWDDEIIENNNGTNRQTYKSAINPASGKDIESRFTKS